MTQVWKFAALLLGCIFSGSFALAGDTVASEELDRRLDPPYRHLHPMVDDTGGNVHPSGSVEPLHRFSALPPRSDMQAVLLSQPPVRDQGQRGTCSIFSSVAMFESLLIREGGYPRSVDLSEQWLAYVVSVKTGQDGSNALRNGALLHSYGIPMEVELPYEPQSWTKPEPEILPKVESRCGPNAGPERKICEYAHYHPEWLEQDRTDATPEFLRAANSAVGSWQRHTRYLTPSIPIERVSEVKALLNAGIPMILEMDYYYGAWNARAMERLGIGARDREAFERGEVGFPEKGSLDRVKSQEGEAASGHSVLVIGYDDEEVIRTRATMLDGQVKEFEYKGVYYFRNSWGTEFFGRNVNFGGVPAPGYGKITQKYAHEMGAFFHFHFR